jgi:hypothetical protein
VRCCILRNYEGFPDRNAGSDIDFLVSPTQLPLAIAAVETIEGIRIIGYLERPSVAMLYLDGVDCGEEARGIEIDFDLSLDWKGMAFLDVNEVLRATLARRAGEVIFLTPSAAHEAITSLFASLLVGGFVKERYFARVQGTFAQTRPEVLAALEPRFGKKVAERLVDGVIAGDRPRLLGMLGRLRAALTLRSFRRQPLKSLIEIARHYWCELVLRFSSATRETVSITGGIAADRERLVAALLPRLRAAAAVVERGAAAGTISQALSRFSPRRNLILRVVHGERSGKADLILRIPTAGKAYSRNDGGFKTVKTGRQQATLDPNQTLTEITESAYAAIMDTLAARANNQLSKRLKQRKSAS